MGLACVVVVVLAILFAPKATRRMRDFEVYYQAAVRARAAEPLYRASDQHYQFKYLPAFAVLAIPLALLTLNAAKVVWLTTSVLLVVALLRLSLMLLPERRKPPWVLIVVTLVAMAKFYGHELVLGQMNLLLGVLVLLALLGLRHGREATAGTLVSLAIVAKPYAAILLPWVVARRRPASIAAAAGGLIVVLALPALWYGLDGTVQLHRDWWQTVTDSTAPNLTNADNVSIAALFAKWIGAGSTATVLALLASLAVVAALAVTFVRRYAVGQPEGLEGGLLLTCIPLLSPQGWDYVFLISTPAVMYLANYEDRLPTVLRIATVLSVATIGLSLFDLMGRAAYAAFMAWSIITLCYVVVVVALCALRIRRIA